MSYGDYKERFYDSLRAVGRILEDFENAVLEAAGDYRGAHPEAVPPFPDPRMANDPWIEDIWGCMRMLADIYACLPRRPLDGVDFNSVRHWVKEIWDQVPEEEKAKGLPKLSKKLDEQLREIRATVWERVLESAKLYLLGGEPEELKSLDIWIVNTGWPMDSCAEAVDRARRLMLLLHRDGGLNEQLNARYGKPWLLMICRKLLALLILARAFKEIM